MEMIARCNWHGLAVIHLLCYIYLFISQGARRQRASDLGAHVCVQVSVVHVWSSTRVYYSPSVLLSIRAVIRPCTRACACHMYMHNACTQKLQRKRRVGKREGEGNLVDIFVALARRHRGSCTTSEQPHVNACDTQMWRRHRRTATTCIHTCACGRSCGAVGWRPVALSAAQGDPGKVPGGPGARDPYVIHT